MTSNRCGPRSFIGLALCGMVWACLPRSQPVGTAGSQTEGAVSSSGAPTSSDDATGPSGGSNSSDGPGSTGSTGILDGTSTGEEANPCDVCADSDICVQTFFSDLCPCFGPPNYEITCVSELPEACGESLTYSATCNLSLCGTPFPVMDPNDGCGCGTDGDFICGGFEGSCDYWADPKVSTCDRDDKCLPALDEQDQPLPYGHCVDQGMAESPIPIGDPCERPFSHSDECEPAALCDEVDAQTMLGVCRPLCIGAEAMPTCAAPDETCVLFLEGQPQFGGVCRPA